jgi:hypothetical protein
MTAFDDETPLHCRAAPPWTECGDRTAAVFGSVYDWPGANGAAVFTFDRAGRRHALTLFRRPDPGVEVVIHGRRFDVARR